MGMSCTPNTRRELTPKVSSNFPGPNCCRARRYTTKVGALARASTCNGPWSPDAYQIFQTPNEDPERVRSCYYNVLSARRERLWRQRGEEHRASVLLALRMGCKPELIASGQDTYPWYGSRMLKLCGIVMEEHTRSRGCGCCQAASIVPSIHHSSRQHTNIFKLDGTWTALPPSCALCISAVNWFHPACPLACDSSHRMYESRSSSVQCPL